MNDDSSHIAFVQPTDWPRPRGYANGVSASGRLLFVAGQIGWDRDERLVSPELAPQFKQALANVCAVVEAAGGRPQDIVRLTIFCTDLGAYRRDAQLIGKGYRELFGKHYPAMALIGVSELVMPGALVEIEANAVLRDGGAK
jgi:enamine deaminase RidA (YjgF/YER057c/UK114 family)